MHPPSLATQGVPSTRAALIRLGGLALILVVASVIGYELGWFDYRDTLRHVARLRGAYSFVVFAIGFVVAFGIGTSVGFPGLPFTVAAGVLFGTLVGSALSWIGTLIGATVGYWVARTVAHDTVVRWTARYRRVDAAVAEARDFDGMLRLRLLPVLPLGTANFVGGLADAPFGSYIAATAIGVIPSIVIYTYFADSFLEGVAMRRSNALSSIVISSVLLILLSLAPKLTRSPHSTS